MTRVLGIDFSGAKDAGRRIWIAEGLRTDGAFRVEACRPASALPCGGIGPAAAIAALARHLAAERDTIAGCDFPFSLPVALVRARTWRQFALGFHARFTNPDSFHDLCHKATGGVEVKRRTDREDRTPFSSFNLRLYRQTWWGISHLLAPMVAAGDAWVWPLMDRQDGVPMLVEVCAASSLIGLDCYPSYKGATEKHMRARLRILEMLVASRLMATPSPWLRRLLLQNVGGDALDAVIGAIAANRVKTAAPRDRIDRLEGRIVHRL